MKTLLKSFIIFTLSLSAFAQQIEGKWRIEGSENASVLFTTVDHTHYSHTEEKFVFPNGNLSHTIDQSVKFDIKNGKIEGYVDFFDSRGCSFKNFKVKGELRSENQMNILMTIPRYKVLRVTVGHAGRYYDRPLYCWNRSPYYPYRSYRYICGYEQMPQNSHTECRLIEAVEVPVTLKRL